MLPLQPNQSIIDGIRCLQILSMAQHSFGAKELSQKLHLEPTRMHRLLRTLAYMGLASQDSDRKYRAGPGMAVMGAQNILCSPLIESTLRQAEEALPDSRYTIEVGIIWGGMAFYLAKGEPDEWETGMSATREIWEATKTPLGIALLAELPEEEVELIYQGRSFLGKPEDIRDLIQSLREARGYGYVRAPSRKGPDYEAVAASLFGGAVGLEMSGQTMEADQGDMILQVRQLAERIEWLAHG